MAEEEKIMGEWLVRVLTLSKQEKLQLIVRLAAQLAQRDILHSDGREAIPHDSILQFKVMDASGNLQYVIRLE